MTSFNRDHATQPGISTNQQCRFHTNNLQKLAQFSKHQTIRPKNPKLSKTQKAPPEKCTRITWFPQNISKSLHFFKETKLLVPSTPPTIPSSEILRQAIASLPLCVPRRRDACVFPRGRRPPRSWRWGKHGDAQRAPGRQQIYHGHQGLLDAASRPQESRFLDPTFEVIFQWQLGLVHHASQ